MNFISSSKILGATLAGALMAAAPAGASADGMLDNGQANEAKKMAAQNSNAKARAGKAAVPAFVYMMVPVEVANKDNSLRSGCWARIYSGTNYTGDTLTLAGPLSLAAMSGPYGLNWDDRVDSVVVGPKATLTVYDDENYREQVAVFSSGRSVPDISRPLGFFDEFKSVRLTCTK